MSDFDEFPYGEYFYNTNLSFSATSIPIPMIPSTLLLQPPHDSTTLSIKPVFDDTISKPILNPAKFQSTSTTSYAAFPIGSTTSQSESLLMVHTAHNELVVHVASPTQHFPLPNLIRPETSSRQSLYKPHTPHPSPALFHSRDQAADPLVHIGCISQLKLQLLTNPLSPQIPIEAPIQLTPLSMTFLHTSVLNSMVWQLNKAKSFQQHSQDMLSSMLRDIPLLSVVCSFPNYPDNFTVDSTLQPGNGPQTNQDIDNIVDLIDIITSQVQSTSTIENITTTPGNLAPVLSNWVPQQSPKPTSSPPKACPTLITHSFVLVILNPITKQTLGVIPLPTYFQTHGTCSLVSKWISPLQHNHDSLFNSHGDLNYIDSTQEPQTTHEPSSSFDADDDDSSSDYRSPPTFQNHLYFQLCLFQTFYILAFSHLSILIPFQLCTLESDDYFIFMN